MTINVKRTISALLAVVTAFGLVVFSPKASAYVFGDFTYTVYDGTATISGYKGSAEEVTIPSSINGYRVTKIRSYAFQNRTALKKVTVPDGVESIGRSAFSGCTSLATVSLPDSLTSIGVLAFNNTSLINGESNYVDRVLYIGHFLIIAKKDVAGSYTVKNGTVTIADNAFQNCALLSGVTLPDTLNSIGNSAFSGCTALKGFTIPSSVTTIGGRALYNCSGVKELSIPDSVKSVGGNAFYGTGLWNDASNWENGVLYIGKYLIKAKNDAASYFKIKEGTACIADGAFMNFTALRSVSIPKTVTDVVYSAFYNCSSLKKVFFSGTEEEWSSVRVEANNTKLTKAEFIFGDEGPDPVDPDNDFTYEASAGKLTITGYSGDGGDVDVPSEIGGRPVAYIGQSAFENCVDLTSVTLPEGVKGVGYCAFNGCSSLEEVFLPASVGRIESYAFGSCSSLTAINVNADNATFSSVDGVLYDKKVKTLIAFPAGLSEVEIPSGVTAIGERAFSECDGIVSVTVPEGVTDIGAEAFKGCASLENVSLPDSLTGIGEGAFLDCPAIEKFVIPDSVKEITASSFEGCDKLSEVKLPSGLTAIRKDAFKNCVALTAVDLPASVTVIGAYAFANCTALVELVLPESVKTIGSSAFENCSSIATVSAPVSLRSVGVDAFRRCSSLQTVYYAGSEGGWIERVDVASGNSALTDAEFVFAKKSAFSDVPDASYFADSVIWAVENGITEGTGKGRFSPDAGCTRGQVVTFLWRAEGCPEPSSGKNPFSDVSESDYFFKAVLWAVEKGIRKGTSITAFSPDATCTRGQIVTCLWRAVGSPEQKSVGNPFSDVNNSHYFAVAVLWALGENVTKGTTDSTFSPDNTCTRAQVVTFLCRALRKD